MKKKLSFIIFAIFTCVLHTKTPPRLTVICVIDGLSYHVLKKVTPYLHGGIHTLLNNGIVYENAYYPHALPTTGPGHTALSTGCYAQKHGIIANSWLAADGTGMPCESDTVERAAVFSPVGFYSVGKSAHNIMVPTISDHMSNAGYDVIAISLKARSGIAMAGKLGKAYWFDQDSGRFTSSTAYVAKLPKWLTDFNSAHAIDMHTPMSWPLNNKNSGAYNFPNIKNYNFAAAMPLAGKTTSLQDIITQENLTTENQFRHYIRFPQAAELTLNLCRTYVETMQSTKKPTVLWIGLTSTDRLGHLYGPQSLEYIDMIYHIDTLLAQFMKSLNSLYKKNEIVFVLTADHGFTTIPEILHLEGNTQAQRILTKELKKLLNKELRNLYAIPKLIIKIKRPYLYCNMEVIKKLPVPLQEKIMNSIVKILQKQPGIRAAWKRTDLEKQNPGPNEPSFVFKKQLYPWRGGQIIFLTDQYSVVSTRSVGSDHCTPYEHDTHVPLIIYQPVKLKKKKIRKKVWAPQLPASLKNILRIPASVNTDFPALPGIQGR